MATRGIGKGKGKKPNTNPNANKRTRKENPSTSNSPSPPINTYGIIFSEQDQANKFAWLNRCTLRPTQFPDEPALETLGVCGNIKSLYEGLDCAGFLSIHELTYTRLTLEFLCSMRKRTGRAIDETGNPFDENFIDFRLLNQNHTISYTHLNQLFGWPTLANREIYDHHANNYSEGVFWSQITNSVWIPRSAKASSIIHPVLRIIHRFYSCTVFGRGEKGTVNSSELYLLWNFVTSNMRINLAKWMVDQFEQCQHATSGEIHIGGLVTVIAKGLRLELPNPLEIVRGPTKLDLRTLRTMTMISPMEQSTYAWLVGPRNTPYTILPDPNLQNIEINQTDTWIPERTIPLPPDQQENQENPPEQVNQGPQLPPELLNQLNLMFHTVQNISQDMQGLRGDMHEIQGRLDYLFDYGAHHWPHFQPPPPPK